MKYATILTAVLVLIAGTLYADHGRRAPMGPGHGQRLEMMNDDVVRPGMLLRWAEEIGLDDNQKATIDKLTQEFKLALIDKEAEMEKARVQMRHLRVNDASESEVLAMIDRIGALETELHKMRYRHHQAIRKILTAEQIDKLKELRRDRWGDDRPGQGDRSGRGDRPGKRDGRGFGPGDGQGNSPGDGGGYGLGYRPGDCTGYGPGDGTGWNSANCPRR